MEHSTEFEVEHLQERIQIAFRSIEIGLINAGNVL